jgi:hypothetical protein
MVNFFSFLSWYTSSKTVFSVHSPRLYDFCNKVVDDERHYYAFDRIDYVSTSLLPDKQVKISPQSIGKTLFRIALWWQPSEIISIGPNQEMTAAYLASTNSNCPLHVLDTERPIRDIAYNIWKKIGFTNIRDVFMSSEEVINYISGLNPTKILISIQGGYTSLQVKQWLDHLTLSTPSFMVIFMGIRSSEANFSAWKNRYGKEASGAWIDLFHLGIWLPEASFLEPVSISICPRKWKPLRLGWI